MVLKVLFSKFLMLKRHFQGGYHKKILKKFKKVCRLNFLLYLCTRVEQVTILARQPIGY